MVRSLVGAVVMMLAVAPAALGAPVALRDDVRATWVALAGPDVLVLRDLHGGGAQLVAVPRAGGAARTLLTVKSANRTWPNTYSLSASDRRVALWVEIVDRHNQTLEWRVYSGPPAGPLKLVRRTPEQREETWIPERVDVDGDRVLLVETQDEGSGATRSLLLDPVRGFVPIAWATETLRPVAIGGDHAVVNRREPRRIVVADLATGAQEASIPLGKRGRASGFDLAADGRLVAATPAGLVTARPGGRPRTLPHSKGLASPTLAGDAIVAISGGRPVVLAANGSRTGLLPPSRAFTDMAADKRGVAWLANGCVRYLALVAPAPQAGAPCPTTEIELHLIAKSKLRGRTVRVPVRCVAAPTGVCRGTVLGKDGEKGRRFVARGRFAVPVGKQRNVPMQVERATVERFRRKDFGFFIIDARIPNGRIGAGAGGSSELTVDLD